MDYLSLKLLHQGLVVASVTGFVARWGWRLGHPAWKPAGLLRAAPHVLDTLLLVTGIVLAFLLYPAPWQVPWLLAKLGGVVIYIVLAWIAFRRTDRPKQSALVGLAALAALAWVASVAVSHQPLGVFA